MKLALGEAKPTGFLLAEAEIVLQRRKQNSDEKIYILTDSCESRRSSSRQTQLNVKSNKKRST